MLGITAIFVVSLLLRFRPRSSCCRSAPDGGRERRAAGWAAASVGASGAGRSRHRRLVLIGGVRLCALSSVGRDAASRSRPTTSSSSAPRASSGATTPHRRARSAAPSRSTSSSTATGRRTMQRLETLAAIRDLQQLHRRAAGRRRAACRWSTTCRSSAASEPGARPQAAREPGRGRPAPAVRRPERPRAGGGARLRARQHHRAHAPLRLDRDRRLRASRSRSTRATRLPPRHDGARRPAASCCSTAPPTTWRADRSPASGRCSSSLFLLMSLLFLSLRAGLLSLVPNVVPIIVLFGMMGCTGITSTSRPA